MKRQIVLGDFISSKFNIKKRGTKRKKRMTGILFDKREEM
jgi:hypothetical protein